MRMILAAAMVLTLAACDDGYGHHHGAHPYAGGYAHDGNQYHPGVVHDAYGSHAYGGGRGGVVGTVGVPHR